MRRAPRRLLALAITMVAAPLWGSPLPTAPPGSAIEALSGIDFVPGRSDLVRLFAGDVAALVGLANGMDGGDPVDPGVRLRAYRSLSKFVGDPIAIEGLRAAVDNFRNARHGTDLLYLVAALGALGAIGDADDVARVVPLLGASDSRDLRAAAARALGGLGSLEACAPLRLHARSDGIEPEAMVQVAANRALTRLVFCD